MNVAFTQDAEANVASLRETFPYANDLKAVAAPRSMAVLQALQDQMRADRTALQGDAPSSLPQLIQDTGGTYDLDIDVRTSTVVARVELATPQLQQAFQDAYSDAVVVQSGVAQPAACSIFDCYPAMMGGLEWDIPNTWTCSTAFLAQTDSGTKYTMSAGHCYTDTGVSARRHGGASYGSVTVYQKSGPVDAERVARTNDAFKHSSKFFVEGEYPRLVDSSKHWSLIVIGTYIGKTGYRTGTTRGYVTSKSIAPGYVPNSYNFVAADMCLNGGDSGGSVWRTGTAWGISSGYYPYTSCNNPKGTLGEGTAIFGAMDYALSALNLTSVAMGLNLGPTARYTYSCTLLVCAFDGTTSTDPDGGIVSNSWNFGDGGTSSSATTSHTYTVPGTYALCVKIK